MPIAATRFPEKITTRMRQLFSWESLGAALLGVMFARWTWLLFAPAGAVMPPANWEASEDSGRVFGTAHQVTATTTLTSGNIRLVGVFANRTRGFAVMQINDKQLGVALGDEVRPGVRLVETHPDYVVLDQGGVRSRVNLSAASAPTGPSGSGPPNMIPVAPSAGTSSQAEALQHQLDAASGAIPREKRDLLQRQIDSMKGGQ